MTRFGLALSTSFAAVAVGMSTVIQSTPRIVWNASASVPTGLYAVRPAGVLHISETVLVRPPEELASFLDKRRYLPIGVPMLKRIAALPGQVVCRFHRVISVDSVPIGDALEEDRSGRPLPTWQGCLVVAQDQVFLMNRRSEASFDGRYFGPLPANAIVGRADPLWTREGG
jgi:conjugative transfer signal peptidase TraF